ncbi:PRC-barrel domain-containing protein [Devosia sp. CN2-171]|uniref:PRC-barrel domain-containing protein n=1 Tax=Devosia sp. CN2-171 TaxID=3400909 RepID=UPI003BF8B4B8
MDHSNHIRVNASEYSPTVLEGATIYDADGHEVGKVSHVHGSGPASEIIVDVGGFLGIGAKPVAVLATQLEFMRDENGDVHAVTNWTKDELKELPEHTHRH